jgi:predicted metal-dependent peptidase
MTEQRKNRVRKKIQESRGRLLATMPFFGLLLMYLKFVAVPGMKKISTNGRCIYFSPDFLEKLYEKEIDYILCHQILHIVCGHIWRDRDLSGDDYHFACDIFLNLILEDYGYDEDKYSHLGYIYRNVSGSIDFHDKTPLEIRDWLPYSLKVFDEATRSKFVKDSEYWWDFKDDDGSAGEIIIDLPEITGRLNDGRGEGGGSQDLSGDWGDGDGADDSSGNGDMRQWQVRAMSLATSLYDEEDEEDKVDRVPEFIQRMITKMKEPSLDWKRLLNNFLQERISDYSFSPPDRRFSETDFFLPDFNEKDFVTKEILFMVDTSGSVNNDTLAAVYSEIRGATEQFSGKLTAKLGFFDTMVTEPIPFESVDDLLAIIPYGGGGTDFRVIFEYIQYELYDKLPACIVVFTDGDGPYPVESQSMGIPVLWILDNNQFTPPWGTVIRIITRENFIE